VGCDHSLSCKNCREELFNVSRNRHLNRDKESLDLLEAFLIKHADHELIFDADDNWVRVHGCTQFEI
jgi:hypothetical protein